MLLITFIQNKILVRFLRVRFSKIDFKHKKNQVLMKVLRLTAAFKLRNLGKFKRKILKFSNFYISKMKQQFGILYYNFYSSL